MFVAKIYLKERQKVELHAMGEATSNAVRVAESLVRQGFATLKSIKSETWSPEDEKKESVKEPVKGKEQFQKIRKIKLVIILEKSINFDKMTETLLRSK